MSTAKGGGKPFLAAFDDPAAAARYSDGPRRFVPGVEALHRMTGLVLAETAPPDARVLVLGAGGGMELLALAEAQSGWSFTGVDPALAMLREAERVMQRHASRAQFVHGLIDDAPPGPFDAGVCLLTLHFLEREERRRTAAEIHRRLRPGAPFVVAHSSFPQSPPADRDRWLDRYAAFAISNGLESATAKAARDAVAANLTLLDPEDDEAVLREAGFRDVQMIYAAFTWRGWVAYA